MAKTNMATVPLLDDEFATLPAYPEAFLTNAKKIFNKYLFFRTVSRGVREYTCSFCGESFIAGKHVLRRTEPCKYTEVDLAEHGEYVKCPECGELCRIVNVKRRDPKKMYEANYFAIFIPISHDNVWVRCVQGFRRFDRSDDLVPEIEFTEAMRYHLHPGGCEQYDRYCYSPSREEFPRVKTFRDAFVWNHGLWCEKYPYYAMYYTEDGEFTANLDHTFLKYSGFEAYEGQRGFNLPYMKYLAWYCVHPQIEMLSKMRHFAVIDDMVLRNSDNRSVLNWNATRPNELYGLDGNEYKEFLKYSKFGGGDLDLLKTFKAINGKGVKDFEKAKKIHRFCDHAGWHSCTEKSQRKKFLSLCKKHRADPCAVISYLEKFQASTCTGCHHFPGLSMPECYDIWADYVAMAEYAAFSKAQKKAKKGKKKPRTPFVDIMPRDLKEAHDKLCIAKDGRRRLTRTEQLIEDAKKRNDEYPKVNEVLESIKELYEYESGEYVVRVPDSLADIIIDSAILDHCVFKHGSSERYLERIEKRESYILFLRKKDTPDVPWYTLEAEPNGTLRQKRTEGDNQNDDLDEALPFLYEWQKEVAKRITDTERELSKKSRNARLAEYAQMRQKSLRIARGSLAGQLLADVLEADLIENLA